MKRLVVGAVVVSIAALIWLFAQVDDTATGKWQTIDNKAGCMVWNSDPIPNEHVTWDGPCDGRITRYGTLKWSYPKNGLTQVDVYKGEMQEGQAYGHGSLTIKGGIWYEGEFVDFEFSGHGQGKPINY